MVWPARSVGADELGQSSAMSTNSTVKWTWPSQLVQTPGKEDVTVYLLTCAPAYSLGPRNRALQQHILILSWP